MSVNINASTTNGLVLTSDTSGELKLQANGADIATVSSTGIAMAAGKTLPAASLTGTLPAIDGAALTGIPNLGVGQTWTNVIGSRSAGVTYTNSTGKPIVVLFSDGNSNIATVSINGTKIGELYASAASVASIATLIIPNGDTYSLSAMPDYWWELR